MSIKKWPGAVVSDVPVVPDGPDQAGSASGVWTLDQQAYWKSQNKWPIAGLLNNAWQINKAYYDAGIAAWDVTTAVVAPLSINITGYDTNPNGLSFSPDGLKFYFAGDTNNKIYEFDLSEAWNLSQTVSFSADFSVATQTAQPRGLFFKPDGTKMYVVGSGTTVFEYDLSTAWSVSTATLNQSLNVSAISTQMWGLFFRSDGLKMYLTSVGAPRSVIEYDLSTAWDISTASYLQYFDVLAEDNTPNDVFFKTDGTSMYVLGQTGGDINVYSLSTPWDVSTSSYVTRFVVSGEEATPKGMFFNPVGSMFFIVGTTADRLFAYNMGSFRVAPQDGTPSDIFFKPDGTKMYIVGATNDSVYEYDLSTAWEISTASFLQSYSVTARETVPRALFFSSDGTQMYVMGTTGDDVNEFALSVAWDISTASYVQIFSVAAQDITPQGLFFRSDGMKMYVVGATNDNVYEYDLSTAWDISTASFLQSYYVGAQELSPHGVFFSTDGTNMYVIGANTDSLNQYTLSTPWDVSTSSYLQTFFVNGQETVPEGVFWRDNGINFWVVGSNSDRVHSYSISRAN